MKRLALVGDYRKEVPAHQAIPLALEQLNAKINWQWLPTTSRTFDDFDAIWLVPASPYKDMEGALAAVSHARTKNKPFLGTCGGFQHALIEYAKNVCHLTHADHAETAPMGDTLIVTPLSCSLAGQTANVLFTPGSFLASICGSCTHEKFNCTYGLNTHYKMQLEKAGMRFSGHDELGAVRAFELSHHPFFVGALFQPERLALEHIVHPLIKAFVQAVIEA